MKEIYGKHHNEKIKTCLTADQDEKELTLLACSMKLSFCYPSCTNQFAWCCSAILRLTFQSLKPVSCFMLLLDSFLCLLLRNNGSKQLLIAFIGPILNKLYLCICLKKIFASYFLRWSKYICKRFKTYSFKYDLNILLFLFKSVIFSYT